MTTDPREAAGSVVHWTRQRFIVAVACAFIAVTGLAAEPAAPRAEGRVLSAASEFGADLREREYRVTWQDRTALGELSWAWHAVNRAQGFRAYFTTSGVLLVPRTAGEPSWTWSLSLRGLGRAADLQAVEPVRFLPDGSCLELDRGSLVESFENDPRGLAHTLVLQERPADCGTADAPLRLELVLGGGLTPIADEDRLSVRFADHAGLEVLHYGGLEARDAEGVALPARMEALFLSGVWTIRLGIDDRDAAYPIEIESLTTTAAWTAESDQEGARLGISVGTAGDVNGDGYDDVIVGAFFYDNGQTNEGAAFLYLGSASGLATEYSWMTEGNEAVALAGRSVGTAGDVNGDGYDDVIVGLPTLDDGGGAWVFYGSAMGLSATPDWTAHSDQFSSSDFGISVGTAGDVNGDGYDDVIVGAHLYDSPGFIQDGRAYVYHGSPSGLSPTPDWVTNGKQSSAAYGISVGTAGDVNGDGFDEVIVGAYTYDNGQLDEGRAYLYRGSASGLSQQPSWTFENNDVRACLGGSVGTAGDVNGDGYDDVIVGAPYGACWDVATSLLGRAYGFTGSASGLAATPDWTVELVQTGAVFGMVSSARDVNDDGYNDVLVGATFYDNGQKDEGASFLYLGSTTGLETDSSWTAEGEQVGARFGFASGTAGDVNGDGVADIVVGAYEYDNGQSNEGRAFLYLGSADVVPAGAVPVGTPLLLSKASGEALDLTWGVSCLASDVDYEVYEGQLGDFSTHTPRSCTTGGMTAFSLVPSPGDSYYLVVPANQVAEGSHGTSSGGAERPPGASPCLPQVLGSCE